MTAVEVVDIMRDGIWVLIKVAGPAMIVSLVIGIAISLFQALTQLQEPTLTFVPKIIVVFAAFVIFLPWMSEILLGFVVPLLENAHEFAR